MLSPNSMRLESTSSACMRVWTPQRLMAGLLFGIFASISEFERELIRGQVRSGLAAVRAKGKKLGRPRLTVDATRIAALRTQGLSREMIANRLDVGEGTVRRAAQTRAKNPCAGPLTNHLESICE